ncbi:MAG: MerR family transcriptional regulator [Planctomycetes bacterium]|nr:MerR family transcriptional regulator [Planctomycetota bacterium]
MAPSPETSYAIGELADQAGVSRRTVRFYVQRGLIDPPEGLGRGSTYTPRHLEQILRVRRLQRDGLDLEAIRRLPEGEAPRERPSLPVPSLVLRVPVCGGVRLEIDADRGVPEPRVLGRLAELCARVLGERAQGSRAKPPSTDERPR